MALIKGDTMMPASDRLFLLTIGQPSRLISIAPDGGDLVVLDPDLGVAPDGIAIDRARRRLYWTYMGSAHNGEDFWDVDGALHGIDMDGTNRHVVVPVGATVTPKQLQCDAARSLLYWCDREGMRVMRARLDGSERTTLVQTGSGPDQAKDRTRHCVGVAIDPVGGHLYWTQKGPPNGGAGRILRAALDLPAGMDPAHRSDIELLFDHLPEPIDLEWDDGTLYWTDRGDPPDGNTLNRARITPGAPYAREILLSGLNEAIGLALDRRNRRAFVADLGGTVRVVPLDRPSAVETVFEGHGPITGIAYLEG